MKKKQALPSRFEQMTAHRSPSSSAFRWILGLVLPGLLFSASARAQQKSHESQASSNESPAANLDGTDEGSDPSFPVGDWNKLMQATHTAPISIPEGSRTTDQVVREYYEWTKKRALDPELEKLKGAPTEAALRPLFEMAVLHFAYLDVSPLSADTLASLAAQLEGSDRRPGLDYIFAQVLWENGRREPALHGFQMTADAPADPTLPALYRLAAQARRLSYSDNFHKGDHAAIEKKYWELFAQNLAETPDDVELRQIVQWHLGDPIMGPRWNREQQYIEHYKKSALPEWARLTMIGQAEMQWGWRIVGHGWRDPSKKQQESNEDHLKKARAALECAWQLRPDIPYAAHQMVVVVGRQGADVAELRLWLDRTIAAQCDYPQVFVNYLNFIKPRENGTFATMLAFGRACAETRRFDIGLTSIYSESLREIGSELEDWSVLYKNPAVAKLLLETDRQRRAKIVGNRWENTECTGDALDAWLAQDFAQASAALAQIRGKDGSILVDAYTASGAKRLGVDANLALRDAALRSAPQRDEYAKAVSALKASHGAEAKDHLEKVYAEADVFTKPLLDADKRLVEFTDGFATDQWTSMPESDRFCWSVLDGGWAWRTQNKRLRLTSPWQFGRSTFRGDLGANYELRGHFTVSRPSSRSGGLMILCGHSALGAGEDAATWWSVKIWATKEDQISVEFAQHYWGQKEGVQYVPWGKDLPFTFRRSQGKVSFSIGDKELIHDRSLPDEAFAGPGAAGFGIIGEGDGSFAEVWGLEARKLDQAL